MFGGAGLTLQLSDACAPPPETAVDRQISFPLSNVLHVNGETNSQPLLQDFTEDIQFMDIEETSGTEPTRNALS